MCNTVLLSNNLNQQLYFVEEGVLVQARNSVFGEKVYFCFRGKRYYVRSEARINELGFKWPDDVVSVSESVLKSYQVGGIVPGFWPINIDTSMINSSIDMREIMASDLRGIGLEVGAGSSPFPIPLECKILYGDRLSISELSQELYFGQSIYDLVVPDLVTDFDDFQGIPNNSLDFIIGCHVIEHTRNPIGSIVAAYHKLKVGGKLLLVVPDKHRTFDKNRPLTDINHLLLDYESPNRERDYAHYEEFYQLAFPISEELFTQTVSEQFTSNYAIHYHVWNYESFTNMINYIQSNIISWSNIWSNPTLLDLQNDIEFYFVLTK